jgi:hypothetical protein
MSAALYFGETQAAEIERLKVQIDQQIKREAIEDSLQKLTVHQRNAAWREVEQLRQQLAEARMMVHRINADYDHNKNLQQDIDELTKHLGGETCE